MILIRVLIGALIAAIIGVALIPLAVLLDLRGGGTGWGLCAEGLGGCRTSYFAGLELVVGLLLLLMALVALVGLLMRLLRILREREAARPSLG